ncbi:MAG: hypothetical protein LBU76_09590 [Azoarcus sp.]|nr:hypothetical protein [Azoarcus sp.]
MEQGKPMILAEDMATWQVGSAFGKASAQIFFSPEKSRAFFSLAARCFLVFRADLKSRSALAKCQI